MAEGGTSQDMERNQPSKKHLQTEDSRGKDKSGHKKKLTKQGALTLWQPQGRDQVRTQKETTQERHLHTGDHRGIDKLAHGKKGVRITK